MLQAERVAGANGIEKFGGREAPLSQIDTALAFDDLERLIEQDGARQDGKPGEVSRKRRVISRDLERTMHACGGLGLHGESFACK
jgi:hypothetical protein